LPGQDKNSGDQGAGSDFDSAPVTITTTDDSTQTTVVDSAVQHAIDLAAVLAWDGEHSYVVATEGGHVRTYAVRSKAFKRWLISKMRGHGVKWPSNPAQWQAIRDNLDSRAEEGGIQPTPSIRIAGRDGAIYIDLGDESWKCIKIIAEKWEVVPHPADGPYFYRPTRMAALPVPVIGGSVGELCRTLNAEGNAACLALAWIVNANWPRGPYPVLPVHGPHGSAKTTRVSVCKALTDPSLSDEETPAVTTPRKPPKDEGDVIAAARNNRIVAFDNISYLPPWLSDSICRLATGAELGGRALYSDFDEQVFSACRPVIFNGVPDVVGQSDLADRCVQSETQKPTRRVSEEQFWHEFKEAWPQHLGVVCDLLVLALKHYGQGAANVNQDVRMKNYATIGESIGVGLGWEPGVFTAIYADNLSSAASDIARGDVIFEPLVAVLADADGEWTGTPGELLTALGASSPVANRAEDWPKSAKALGNRLTRLDAALRIAGIEVGAKRTVNGKRVRTIRQVHPASAPAEATEGAE
jgi:hypothetical protein